MGKNCMNWNFSRSKNPRVKFKKKFWRFSHLVRLLGIFHPFKFLCVCPGCLYPSQMAKCLHVQGDSERGRTLMIPDERVLFAKANIFQIRFAVCFECRLRHGDNHLLNNMPFPAIPTYSNRHRRSKKSPFTLIWDLVVQELFSPTFYPPQPEPTNVPTGKT